MKVLKIIGIILLVLIVLGVLAVVTAPSEAHLERSITINAPTSVVFAEINGFKSFDQFSAWAEIDTATVFNVTGPLSGVGSTYSWSSENPDLGEGTISIVASEPNKSVTSKMSFRDFPGEPNASWLLEEAGDDTKVTYTYDQANISGIWKLFAYGTDAMLGPLYERTLEKLKNRVESRPSFAAEIGLMEVKAIPYAGLSVTSSMNPQEMSMKIGNAYGKILSTLAKEGITQQGYPLAVTTEYSESSLSMICGIPVPADAVLTSEEIQLNESPEGDVLKGLHYGDYSLLEKTHDEISQYASFYGYTIAGMPWEIYVTDPGLEADTSKWLTEVYYPIQ